MKILLMNLALLSSVTCFGICFPNGNTAQDQLDMVNCLQNEQAQRNLEYNQQRMLRNMEDQTRIQQEQLEIQEKILKMNPYAR